MNDSSDPFYTSLKPGAYDAVKPSGRPCDAAFPCSFVNGLSTGGTIAMAVVISVVGLGILIVIAYWFRVYRKTKKIA